MIPNSLEAWRDFALDNDDRSIGIRRAIAELLLDLAAGSNDPSTASYLRGMADSLVRPSRLRVERPKEIQ